MADPGLPIAFDRMGIATVLRSFWLRVPLNQREYSWTDREVTDLFHDINKAIADNAPMYFLGSIVAIPREEATTLEVVDGQQRLATTAILLAAIREYLKGRKGDELIVQDIDGILSAVDRAARERKSRLKLNVIDNDYFKARILEWSESSAQHFRSHRLIDRAAMLAKVHVRKILSAHDEKNHGDVLNRWINFIEQSAVVVLLKVPSEVDAYRMFETLNGRGLQTSQSDLVKNYLFGQAKDRAPEAQEHWAGMRAILESFEDDDITVNYLRQMLISLYGYIRESDVYDTVTNQTKGASSSISFLGLLASGANDYAAILNPEHEKWNTYPPGIRSAIRAISIIRVRALRPLMLAIARKFDKGEAEAAMRLLVSASVRLMIAGGAKSAARSDLVEEALAGVAKAVSDGTITATKKLLDALDEVVPKNPQFEEAFANASVSKAEIARYYLRCLEMTAQGLAQPYYLPNDDAQVINLEHVLPRSPEGNWPQVNPEMAEAFHRRLGNMALLLMKSNADLKSLPFEAKRDIYKESPYVLTLQLAEHAAWDAEAIADRQKVMAALAVKTWPLTFT